MQDASRRERRALALATALIAVHVLVEGLLAPEPGTRLRDHVVPVGVPLALLALAGVVMLRSRAGAVGATALVLGTWALVGAGAALAEAAAGGIHADDVTGAVLGLAGVALIVLGAHVLWRSRRHEGRWILRRVARVVFAALIAVWLVLPVAVAIVATHRPQGAADAPLLGRGQREVTLVTGDGLELRASYVPGRNGAAIVVFPERRGTAAHARMLARNGYGVLAVDMRGYGGSEGDPNAFGWGATPDVDAAVAYLAARDDVVDGRIGGLGLSVGGEVLLEAAARSPALRAVVSDGAGERSVRESASRGLAAALVLPLQTVQTAAVAILSGDAPPEALQDLVPRISPRAILLVVAGRGGGGEELSATYFAAAGDPKQLWEIPEARHTRGLAARPREYERRVVTLLDEALDVER